MSLTFLQVGQPLEWTNLPPPPPPPAGTTCALARCVGIDTAAVKARLPATSAGYYETGTLCSATVSSCHLSVTPGSSARDLAGYYEIGTLCVPQSAPLIGVTLGPWPRKGVQA